MEQLLIAKNELSARCDGNCCVDSDFMLPYKRECMELLLDVLTNRERRFYKAGMVLLRKRTGSNVWSMRRICRKRDVADRFCEKNVGDNMRGMLPNIQDWTRREGDFWVGEADSDLYTECSSSEYMNDNGCVSVNPEIVSDEFSIEHESLLEFMVDYSSAFNYIISDELDLGLAEKPYEIFKACVYVENCDTKEIFTLYKCDDVLSAKGILLGMRLEKGRYRFSVCLNYNVYYDCSEVTSEYLNISAYCTAYMGNKQDGSLRQGRISVGYDSDPDRLPVLY